MFGNAMHGRIFAAIMTLRAGGRLANPLTLPDVLRDDPGLAGSITTMGNAVFRQACFLAVFLGFLRVTGACRRPRR
jgi:hypothetical protein